MERRIRIKGEEGFRKSRPPVADFFDLLKHESADRRGRKRNAPQRGPKMRFRENQTRDAQPPSAHVRESISLSQSGVWGLEGGRKGGRRSRERGLPQAGRRVKRLVKL